MNPGLTLYWVEMSNACPLGVVKGIIEGSPSTVTPVQCSTQSEWFKRVTVPKLSSFYNTLVYCYVFSCCYGTTLVLLR